jgi:phosphatidylglycerophosphatase A
MEPENTHVSFSLFRNSAFNAFQKCSILVVTFFGLGLMPIAPGTWGSLGGLALYVLMSSLIWQQQLQIIVLVMLLGVAAIAHIQRKLGPRDDGRIVIDEVVGMMITLASFPLNWFWMVLGFFVFRLLDIWKPFPARHVDRYMHGAWGVMLDDVVSGIYALAILKVVESLRVFV